MTTGNGTDQAKVVASNTTMATWAGAIARALDASGIDAPLLFARAGIDYSLVNHPEQRIPVADMTRLWHLAVSVSRDPGFGLVVAQHVNLTTFHALGVAAMASETVRQAADMISRFAAMVSDGADMQLHEDSREVGLVLAMRPGYPRYADACIEAIMAAIFLSARQLVPDIRASRVTFRHKAAAELARYQALFDCQVVFNAAQDGVFGAAETLAPQKPLLAASPLVARANEEVCEQYLAARKQGETSSRVRDLLGEGLRQGRLYALPELARTLAMSERKLQRLLREEGVAYRELIDEVRALEARQLLDAGNIAVSRIAEHLGFESLSAFSRAFKRWYGQSPTALRQSARRQSQD